MNFNTIKMGMRATTKGAELFLKKYGPDICTYGGTALTIGGTVWIGVVSRKAHTIVDDMKAALDLIAGKVEAHEIDKKQARKESRSVYVDAFGKLGKLYGIPVAMEVVGYVMIFNGHAMLKNQAAILSAAYIALDKAYSEYRRRVEDVYGHEREQEIYTGHVSMTNPDDGTKYIEEYGTAAMPHLLIFTKYIDAAKKHKNRLWNDDPIECLANIRRIEADLDKQFHDDGYLFLNDIMKATIGHKCKEGQYLGMIYKPGEKEHFTFNIPDIADVQMENFMSGNEDGLELFIELDGPIMNRIPDTKLPPIAAIEA